MNEPIVGRQTEPSALLGREVAIVHPAWHSCGSYQSILGQVEAYRAMGAHVSMVAVSTDPGFIPERSWIWRTYIESTPELDCDARFYAGAPLSALFYPSFVRDVVWPYAHGDQAIIRRALAEQARFSKKLAELSFDVVHCNHFFLMPVAKRLSDGRSPILLDSHDLQARQFMLMNKNIPWLRPHATYEAMLAIELESMRGADLLLHVNIEEHETFSQLLPEKLHALLYPAGPEAPQGPGGDDIVIVASNNTANVESVVWFLREVASRAPEIDIKIIGNIDLGMRSAAPEEYRRYRDCFVGRVDDVRCVYENARLVLLPMVEGFGLSIKTLEAMASGLPMIATSAALRGMKDDVMGLREVTIADDAESFSRALKRKAREPRHTEAQRRASGVRAYFDANFSQAVYRRNLEALVGSLLENGRRR
jgi:glycosyltransferase involved in cell wall biosynthesis